jgi:hypothetical protein
MFRKSWSPVEYWICFEERRLCSDNRKWAGELKVSAGRLKKGETNRDRRRSAWLGWPWNEPIFDFVDQDELPVLKSKVCCRQLSRIKPNKLWDDSDDDAKDERSSADEMRSKCKRRIVFVVLIAIDKHETGSEAKTILTTDVASLSNGK